MPYLMGEGERVSRGINWTNRRALFEGFGSMMWQLFPCRVPRIKHLANSFFAECQTDSTRQTFFLFFCSLLLFLFF